MGKQKEERYLVEPTFDQDGVQASAGINQRGQEVPDPHPMEPPLDYTPPMDLMTMIRSMIVSERFKQRLLEEGFETFDEADDFEIEDDPLDPMTEYEKVFLPSKEAPPGSGQRAPKEAAAAKAETPSSAAGGPTNPTSKEAGVSSPPPGNSELKTGSSTVPSS